VHYATPDVFSGSFGRASVHCNLLSSAPPPQPLPHELGVSRFTVLSGVWVEGAICSLVEATLLHVTCQPTLLVVGTIPLCTDIPIFLDSGVSFYCSSRQVWRPCNRTDRIRALSNSKSNANIYRQKCHSMIHPPNVQLYFTLFGARHWQAVRMRSFGPPRVY